MYTNSTIDTSAVTKSTPEFPFMKEIIEMNHDYIMECCEETEDFDSVIILTNLYLYTCKFMHKHNMTITKDAVYTNMKKLFNIIEVRRTLIGFFTQQKRLLKKTRSVLSL